MKKKWSFQLTNEKKMVIPANYVNRRLIALVKWRRKLDGLYALLLRRAEWSGFG